ncbi:protein of unknown function [Paraburkholderia dioscoreae]|uniref:Uncharacterized protein n=1 Tax=Paraburkholderia dioscoreae TaxID=2604047 RepID=A0A5Q4ZME3_9BURK|nr:protein of unknown function [Paraburkholderia dioscoreae]
MDLCESLIAYSQTMEIIKPGILTYVYPSILSKSASMLSLTPMSCDCRLASLTRD